MTSPKKQVSSSEWKVGDKVTHKAWGEGMVSNVNEKWFGRIGYHI